MSLQVSNLKHNNVLVKLSIDEQVNISGGGGGGRPLPKSDKTLYTQALDTYSKGNATINSSGNTVFFTESGQGNSDLFGSGNESGSPLSIGFVVQGDNVQRYNPNPPSSD
jgi:ankyrin repeat protein